MPNAIKYNVSAETLALKKGNFWIGTGDVGKGPTSSTGFYNGITPPSGGYTIYLNKSSGGPSIYTVTTEAQMVSLTNSIGSQNFTTSGQCLNWFATQTDKMIFNIDYPAIVTNGLVLNVDAGFTPSYPTINTTWYDISSNVNNGTLTNGPTFNSVNGGSITFDGVDDIANFGNIDLSSTNKVSVSFWCKIITYTETPGAGHLIFEVSTNFNGSQTGFLISYADDSNPSFLGLYPLLLALKGDVGYTIPAFSKTLVNDLQWHHYVCIYDKSQTSANDECKLYLDGTLRTPIFYPGGLMSNNTNNFGNDPLFIASRSGASSGLGNIQISIFSLYNRVLTQTEVTQNYNATKGRFGL
jgi:hypothetical protein